ncbi:hypothetical protein D915_000369 [Fasciola hepatica]|uniref:Uncharacterized protein n=1 Tax=Fasciola hepatica TaxID=6192 RepID=A0A4E0S0D3_FASHE|nr:hypothetical protein D915_000369 [Fasciola hepatica]
MFTNVNECCCRVPAVQLLLLILIASLCDKASGTCFWCFVEKNHKMVAEFNSFDGTFDFIESANKDQKLLSRAEFWNYLRGILQTQVQRSDSLEYYKTKHRYTQNTSMEIPPKSCGHCCLEVCLSERRPIMTNGTSSTGYMRTVIIESGNTKCGPLPIFLRFSRNSLRQYVKGKCSIVNNKYSSGYNRTDQNGKFMSSWKTVTSTAKTPSKRIRSAIQVHASSITAVNLNQSQDSVPTYRLPMIHAIPARAVLIGPSHLIPEKGPSRSYNEPSFLAYKFHVLQAACGVFQILPAHSIGNNGHWNTVEQFTGDQILRRQVRYLSTLMQPEDDSIPFEDLIHLTCLGFPGVNSTRVRLLLPVIFTRIHLKLFTPKAFTLDLLPTTSKSSSDCGGSKSRTRPIELENLQVTVKPPERDQSIYFTVLLAPKHGHLFLSDGKKISNRSVETTGTTSTMTGKMYLGVNSQFTQQHIREGHLFYTFRRVLDDGLQIYTKDTVIDGFDFRIHVPGAQLKATYHFHITINNLQELRPVHTRIRDTIHIVHEPARVLESGVFIFRPSIFYARQRECAPPNFDMQFQVLALPNHGVLQIRRESDPSQAVLMKRFTFYPVNIIDKRLMEYRHDGSETIHDNFQYQFACQIKHYAHRSTIQEVQFVGELIVGTFRLDIIPLNNNPPGLKIQSLIVPLDQTTPVPAPWISVTDEDSIRNRTEDSPKLFPITWEVVPNLERPDFGQYPSLGQFQNRITKHRVNTFTMEDLIRGNLSFRHMGLPMGYIRLHVTDGKFHSSAEMFINVSRAVFIALSPIYPVVGNLEVGAPLFFEVLTNIDLDPKRIFISLAGGLCNGCLKTLSSSEPVQEFTYEDVLNYRIYYRSLRSLAGGLQNASENCNRTPNVCSTGSVLLGDKEMEAVALNVRASYASHTWQKSVSVRFSIERDEYLNDESTVHSVWKSKQLQIIKENVNLETDGFVPLSLRRELNANEVTHSPSFLFKVNHPPVHGILVLRTPSFTTRQVDTFTLADVLAERVLYVVNKSFEFSSRLHAFQDCILLSWTYPKSFVIDTMRSKVSQSKGRVCVIRKRNELRFQAFDLTVGKQRKLPLNEANLIPFPDDVPIRHDQPTDYQQQDEVYQHVSLEKHLPFSHQRKQVTLMSNVSNKRVIFFLTKQPQHGIVISKRLNRSISVFSNQDLLKNDIFYVYQKSTREELEDLVQLRAFNSFGKNSFGTPVTLKIYLQPTIQGLRLSKIQPVIVLVNSFVRLSSDYLAAGFGLSKIVPEIVYELRTTYGGYVAFTSNLYRSANKFTQHDLDQERVVFMHNGETDSISGFDFFLNHGKERSTKSFHYIFHVYRAHIETVQTRTLEAFPLGFERIRPWHLEHRVRLEALEQSAAWRTTNSNGNANRHTVTVLYGVLSQPKHGRLIKRFLPTTWSKKTIREEYTDVNYFTQDDINEGRIFYVFNILPNRGNLKDGIQNQTAHQNHVQYYQNYQTPISLRPTEPGMHPTSDSFLLNLSVCQHSLGKPINSPLPWSRVQHTMQFNISIAFSHVNKQNQDRLFLIRPVLVDKDGTGDLTWTNIDPHPLLTLYEHNTVSNMNALHLKVIRQPRHGSLRLSDGSPFTQVLVTKNYFRDTSFRVCYVHDGSETVSDWIYLRLDNNNDPLDGEWNETGIEVPVLIRSMNDRRPRMIRPNSQFKYTYTSSTLSSPSSDFLVECLNGLPVIISNRWLYATDEDSQPSEIQFEVIAYPEFGRLCLTTSSNIPDYVSGSYNACQPCTDPCLFNQFDVDENRLMYIASFHTISSPILDSFTVLVRDINQDEVKSEPSRVQGTITLRIWPAELVTQTNTVYLLQGEFWTPINQNNVQISLRTKLNQTFTSEFVRSGWLWFTVVQPPAFGKLCLDTVPVLSFSYADFLKNRLIYHQISRSSPTDSMVLRVEIDPWSDPLWKSQGMFSEYVSPTLLGGKSMHTEFSLYIEVKPRLTIGDLEIEPGTRIAVSKDVFNASMLWNLIRRDADNDLGPVSNFTPMVTFPSATHLRLGRFLVNDEVVVTSDYPDNELTSNVNITLGSIDSGELQFESYQIPDVQLKHPSELEERISFVLWGGPTVQPARGSIKVRIVRDTHGSSMTELFKSVRQVPYSSGSSDANPVKEDTHENPYYFTTFIIAVGLGLLIFLTIGGTLFYLYRKRFLKLVNRYKRRRSVKENCVASVESSASNPQSTAKTRLIPSTRLHEMHVKSANQIPQGTKVEVEETDVTKSTHHYPSELRSTPRPNRISECSCDFGGTVIYVTPTQHNAFHTFSSNSQTATSSQMIPDFVVLSDLSTPGLHMITPSVSAPATSITTHICDAAQTGVRQTVPPRVMRLSTSIAQSVDSNEPLLSQARIEDKPVNFSKLDPFADDSVSVKTVIPGINLSSPNALDTSNLPVNAHPCLIQITPYSTDTLTLTSIDSVPMWITHQQ